MVRSMSKHLREVLLKKFIVLRISITSRLKWSVFMLLAGLGPLNSRFRELIFNCLSLFYLFAFKLP